MLNVSSPAVAIVGRHNSGKTTLIEKLITELTKRGLDVGSVKHHSHVGFSIDIPGKDSYRHRAAGATETVIASPGQVARVKTIEGELECSDIVASMPDHDIVIVEGYRKSGLATIELMRQGNEADVRMAHAFKQAAESGLALGTDFCQLGRAKKTSSASETSTSASAGTALDIANAEKRNTALNIRNAEKRNVSLDLANKAPRENTVAVVSDILEALQAARIYNLPTFDPDDVVSLANFVQDHFVRPPLSVVIQAGGESRRMGQSKATVLFEGKPLITRLVKRLSPVADELIITTNEPENLEFLHAEFPQLNISLVRDTFDFRGALPGLFSALNAASNSYVAVVACDMIFASARLIAAESIAMNESGASVVVPVNKHGFEPFHAMYNRDTCLPAIKRALERGDRRAQSFFGDSEVRVLEFSQKQVLEAEPRGRCFVNVNTPEELKALENSLIDQEK